MNQDLKKKKCNFIVITHAFKLIRRKAIFKYFKRGLNLLMYINLLLMGAGGNISWWRNHPLPTAALSTPCPEGGVGKENMGTTGSFVSGTGDIGFDTLPEHCVTQAICSGISNLPLRLLQTKLEHIACTWVAPAPCSGCPSFSRSLDQAGPELPPSLNHASCTRQSFSQISFWKTCFTQSLKSLWMGRWKKGLEALGAGMKWGRNTECTNRKTLPCCSSLPQLLPARLKPCPQHALQLLSILKHDEHQGHSAHLTTKPFFPGAVTKGASCTSTDYPWNKQANTLPKRLNVAVLELRDDLQSCSTTRMFSEQNWN